MLPLLLGGGVAAGLLKNYLVDAPAAERDRKLQSQIARYSPWTGLAPTKVNEANPFNSALQFGSTGAALGQESEKNDLFKKWLNGYKGIGPQASMDNSGFDTREIAGNPNLVGSYTV